MSSFTLQAMLKAKVHIGHLPRFRHPKMAPFIRNVSPSIQASHHSKTRKKDRYQIINLEQTLVHLEQTLKFVTQLSQRPGSQILFVGTKRSAQAIIKEQAIRAGMPHVAYKWLGGMLTNYSTTILQPIKKLKELEFVTQQDSNSNGLTKKEISQKQQELLKLERSVGGMKDMPGLPDALLIVDIGFEHKPVSEAKRLGIPIIGIVDTNNSPQGIDHIILSNDDSPSAISLCVTAVADAILEGRSHIKASESSTKKPEPLIKKALKIPNTFTSTAKLQPSIENPENKN